MATLMIQRCPTCHVEVKEGMARCRDCGTSLYNKESSPPASNDLPMFSKDGRLYTRCLECGKKIKAQLELAGKLIKCPRCDGPVRVQHLPDQEGSGRSSTYSGASPPTLSSTSHVGPGPAASGVRSPAQSDSNSVRPATAGQPQLSPQYPPQSIPVPYPGYPPQVAGYPPGAYQIQPSSAAAHATPAHEFQTPIPPTVSSKSESSTSEQTALPQRSPTLNSSQASGLLSGTEITRLHATCDACGKRVNAASTFAGHNVACPRCGESILLPGEQPERHASSASTLASSHASMSSSQSQSVVMSAHLLRAVEAALVLPDSVPETPVEEIQPLTKKTLKQYLDTIGEAAADPKSAKKDSALKALQLIATSHDISVVGDLIAHLQQAGGTVRLRLITTLGALRCPESFEVIARRLVSANGPELTACIQALGALGDTRGVLPILYAIQKYPDQRIRGFDAIVEMGKPVLSELSRLAAEAGDMEVQFSIAEMLSRFPGACPVDTFSRLMANPRVIIRQRAAESLAKVADGNAVSMLIKAIGDEDAIVRMFAAQGLRLAPSGAAAKALLKAIDDPDRDVRLSALGALGECNQQSVTPALLRCSEDPDVEVAIVASEGLARTGDPSGVPKLIDILESQPVNSEDGFALRIVEGFRKLKDKRTSLPLLNLLLCNDALLRLRAVESLGQGSDRSCRPSLEKLLKFDQSDDVRIAAAKALGDLGDPEAREALQVALNDTTQVRLKAVIALGQLRSKESLPALLALLHDPSPQVKYQTLRAIGEIKDPSAIAAVESLVDVEDEMLRRAALKALQELGDVRDESSIRKSLKKRSKDEKRAKVKAPGKSFSLYDLVPAPLLGVIETVRMNRASSLISVGSIAVAAVVGYMFFFSGGTSIADVQRGRVSTLSVSPNGRYVVTGRNRGLLEIWDAEQGEVVGRSIDIPTQFVVFGADESSLFATQSGRIVTVPVDNGWPGDSVDIAQISNPVMHLDVNADHTYAVTLSTDQLIYRWNLRQPKVESPLQSAAQLTAVAISVNGSQVVGASQQGAIVVWNYESATIVAETAVSVTGKVTQVAFQQDGGLVVAGTTNGELIVWDSQSSRQPEVDRSNLSAVAELAMPPGGAIVVCRSSGQIEKWKVEDMSVITFSTGLEPVSSMSLAGGRVAVGSEEASEIVLMNLTSGNVEGELDE